MLLLAEPAPPEPLLLAVGAGDAAGVLDVVLPFAVLLLAELRVLVVAGLVSEVLVISPVSIVAMLLALAFLSRKTRNPPSRSAGVTSS
jgi:hypothetical protein